MLASGPYTLSTSLLDDYIGWQGYSLDGSTDYLWRRPSTVLIIIYRRFLLTTQGPQGTLQCPLVRPPQNHVLTSLEGATRQVQRT